MPPARPNSVDSQQCGHIFCTKEATCCETSLPEPFQSRNNTKYGICGAPRAKCCGLLVCGENAVCCHGDQGKLGIGQAFHSLCDQHYDLLGHVRS
ncbi:unnamed protein product [Prorocentrum cordatum]|uniref:Uncharacterized protein n=1 Tax=Prorocentrum cordatum TaxID=2364126 RepID=A0ABN9PIX5_9DINO|nr:unnamed protein product [Polarella glacialis]